MANRRERKRLRLAGYDYSTPGAYFVTIVTRGRGHRFGEVVNGEMVLNPYGQIVERAWRDLPHHYPHVMLDAFVVMPNHVHGIIVLTGDDANTDATVVTGGVVVVVGDGFKPSPTVRSSPTGELQRHIHQHRLGIGSSKRSLTFSNIVERVRA